MHGPVMEPVLGKDNRNIDTCVNHTFKLLPVNLKDYKWVLIFVNLKVKPTRVSAEAARGLVLPKSPILGQFEWPGITKRNNRSWACALPLQKFKSLVVNDNYFFAL